MVNTIQQKTVTKPLSKIEIAKSLDKYYTKSDIAGKCFGALKAHVEFIDISNVTYFEPSAGNGAFSKILPAGSIAIDLLPETESVIKMDYLNGPVSSLTGNKTIIVIGNPPFGKKAKLAIEFLNKSLSISVMVGFIVPVQFRKWSVQSKINNKARLIYDHLLPKNSFLLEGKNYDIGCCFQIWTTDLSDSFSDLRIDSKPPTAHPDFEVYQYNRTVEAEKYFDYEWDFAVPRQGYYDYNIKAYNAKDCDRKLQWIFFKAKNNESLKRLLNIDYNKLSNKNIGTPGFGKADLIGEYNRILQNEQSRIMEPGRVKSIS